MKVGRVEIVPVHDGTARIPIEKTVVHPRGAAWDCHHQPLVPDGRIRMDIGAFLLRLGARTVLVDAGAGPGFEHDGWVTGGLLTNLSRTGVAPGEITDVVFTHLHIDHVGWSAVHGEVTFPNAVFRAHAADWDYFMTGPAAQPALQELFEPVTGHMETFDSETELVPGLIARPAPVHTPGRPSTSSPTAPRAALLHAADGQRCDGGRKPRRCGGRPEAMPPRTCAMSGGGLVLWSLQRSWPRGPLEPPRWSAFRPGLSALRALVNPVP